MQELFYCMSAERLFESFRVSISPRAVLKEVAVSKQPANSKRREYRQCECQTIENEQLLSLILSFTSVEKKKEHDRRPQTITIY